MLIFQPESVRKSLKSLIESIIENSIDSASWVKLIFITEGLSLNSALHKDFFRALGDLDFQAIWDDESALAILSFLVDQKAILSIELQSQLKIGCSGRSGN